MSFVDALRHRVRALLHRATFARELDDEFRFHLEQEAQQHAPDGLALDDARAAARRRFGSTSRHTDDVRRAAGLERLDGVAQDIRFGLRSLARERTFSAFVIATLALGIGAGTAMFGIMDRLLLRGPAHVRDAAGLQRLYLTVHDSQDGVWTTSWFSYAGFLAEREARRSFTALAAYAPDDVIMGRGAGAAPLQVRYATWDFYALLGVAPALGRFYTAAEDTTAGAQSVIVLGHGLWQRAFGGDSAVIGRVVEIDRQQLTVIGVAPRGFTGVELERIDAWLPMGLRNRAVPDWRSTWRTAWLRVIARLAPDATHGGAAIEATMAYRRHTEVTRPGYRADITVAPIRSNNVARETRRAIVSRWSVVLAAVVLFIACLNVANLLLARALRRRREAAVQLALGAGRGRLVRMLLVESGILALGGLVAGLLVANVATQIVRRTLLSSIDWSAPAIDARALALAAFAALVTALAIGIVPAVQASRTDLMTALRRGSAGSGHGRSTIRNAMTVVQIALSVALLVGAGLFVRSLRSARGVDLGLDADRVVVATARRSADDTAAPDERAAVRNEAFARRAAERVQGLPGVERTSLVIGMPFVHYWNARPRLPGQDTLSHPDAEPPVMTAVASDYFATVGTRLVAGRAFTAADRAQSEPVTIVSAHAARVLAGVNGPNVLGACLVLAADSVPCARIVGIAADTRRWRIDDPPSMQFYVPLGQLTRWFNEEPTVVVRTRGDPAAVVEPLRRALHAVDPTIDFVDVGVLQDRIDPQTRAWMLGSAMFGLSGLLALIVAAVGLYSVMAYLVTQRTHEVGVRIALGARATDVVRLVLRDGLGLAAIGLAIGLTVALYAGRFLDALLFHTGSRDAGVFATVTVVMLLVAAAASAPPAWRASRVHPLDALRSE